MFSNHIITNFFTECASEKYLKICQYLANVLAYFWATLYRATDQPTVNHTSQAIHILAGAHFNAIK